MANRGKPDPGEEALALAVVGEAARALTYHEDRATVMRDKRALAFLAGSERRVGIEAMAEAAGVSSAAVRSETARAKRLPSVQPDRPTHLLASARAERALCGMAVDEAVPQVLAAHARLHDYEHAICSMCYGVAGLLARRCPVCDGALSGESVRCCCERCGHKLSAHTSGLDCGVCGQECGLDATRSVLSR